MSKYYNLKNILAYNATYNIIFGMRSNGKTYSVLLYGLKNWCEGKGQLAIIRRWKEDITGRRASEIFSSLNANGEIKRLSEGKYSGICYWSGKFYACNYNDDNKPIYTEDDCIAYTFSLSEMEHNKSISYPYITTIMFDEFLTKSLYLQDEFILFMNTISTIVRQRTNVKIFMLGNTVNKYCPYFDEMGLTNIQKMKQGTIDLYKYGDSRLTVAVEYCKNNNASKRNNNFYFAFQNPKLEMITNGAWELDIFPHLPYKYKPKDILFTYFIEFSNNVYQCEIIQVEDKIFTYIHEKTTPIKDSENDLIYTLEYKASLNYNRNIFKPTTKIGKKILWFFKADKVFYQNNNVGNSIENYLKICKGGLL